jgi:hypothetical protein
MTRRVGVVTRFVVSLIMASSTNFEADAYEREGNDWIFFLDGREVVRLPIAAVERIRKVGSDSLTTR